MKAVFNENTTYPVVSVKEKPYLYIEARVERESVPEGIYVYEVADAESDGCFARIQEHVLVNFLGTIIGKHPISETENGNAYYPKFGSEEYEGCRLDEKRLSDLLSMPEDYDEYECCSEVHDGEYAVFPGRKYRLYGYMELSEFGNGDLEEINFELPDIGLESIKLEGSDEKWFFATVTFSPKKEMRIAAVIDMLNEMLAGSLKASFYLDHPFCEIIEEKKIVKEEPQNGKEKYQCVMFRDLLEDDAPIHYGILLPDQSVLCFCCGGTVEQGEYEIIDHIPWQYLEALCQDESL